MPGSRLALGAPSRSLRRRRTLTGVLVALVVCGGVACGDDDDGPSEAKAEFASYCEATYALESYFAQDPDVDFRTASPGEIVAATTAYLQGAKPLIDVVVPITPEEIKDPVDVQVRAFNQALRGAAPETVFETPEVQAAEEESHAFDLENCGWGQVDVKADDYSFSGLPDELEAGRTNIDLTNEGKELHEITLLSRNPGVTETFDQLLALPREEAIGKVNAISFASAPPGLGDFGVADLAAGTYLAVCFIPQGVTSDDATPADDAKPHYLLGMKQEITVA